MKDTLHLYLERIACFVNYQGDGLLGEGDELRLHIDGFSIIRMLH